VKPSIKVSQTSKPPANVEKSVEKMAQGDTDETIQIKDGFVGESSSF